MLGKYIFIFGTLILQLVFGLASQLPNNVKTHIKMDLSNEILFYWKSYKSNIFLDRF